MEDERSSVELVRRFHGNLEPEYLVTNRGDLLAENRRLREVLEVPCKAVLNLPWMYESYRLELRKTVGSCCRDSTEILPYPMGIFEACS